MVNDAAFAVTTVNNIAPVHFQGWAVNSDNIIFARELERCKVVTPSVRKGAHYSSANPWSQELPASN